MTIYLVNMGDRRRLADLARSPSSRFIGEYPERPNKWFPGRVKNVDGYGFTDQGAWDCLAGGLEDQCQLVEIMKLDKPPNGVGYVLKMPLTHLHDRLYLKFEFLICGRNVPKLCGRSFHLEEHT